MNLYVKEQPSSDKEAEACAVYVAVKFTTKYITVIMKRDLMANYPVICNYIDPLPILHVFHVCIHSMKHTVSFHSLADSIATLDLTLHILPLT